MWPFDRLARRLKDSSAEAPAPSERRRDARYGVGAATMVVFPGEQAGVRAFIRDISKGGCRFDTEAKLEVGAKLSLAFLSKRCGHCHAVGCVVRTTGDHCVGVQFSQVNMAFLGFVGSVSSASPEGRLALLAAMRGSTIEIAAS